MTVADRPDRRRGRWSRWLQLGAGLAMLAVAVVAHGWFWYAPRWHPLDPDRARLTVPAAAEASLWIPFPHQNLGALERSVPDPERAVGAMGRLLGRERVTIPRLGLLGVPAARELAIDWMGEGDPNVRAAVYPLWRWLAKSAGRLAGNPWLKGGAVPTGGVPRTVRWEGGIWELGDGRTSTASDVPAAVAGDSPVWARFEERRPGHPLPPGTYDLTARTGELRLVTAGRRLEAPPLPQAVVLLVVDRRHRSPTGVVIVEGGTVRIGDRAMPGLAAFAASEEEALRVLPAGRWLDGILELPAARGETALVATDRGTLALAEEALDSWRPWMAREELSVAAFLRPEAAARLADVVADLLEDLPFSRDETRNRWRDVATALGTLSVDRLFLAG